MDSAALVMDIEEVRRIGQPFRGSEVSSEELTCYQVDGFGHYRHKPSRPVCSVKDWPTIWTVAIMDEANDQYFLHDSFATPDEAQSEAQRLAKNLLCEQGSRRRLLWRRFGPNVLEGTDAFGMIHDPYVRFEALLKWEKILFGPLTDSGAATFAQWHGEELAGEIAELQHRLAIEKLLVFTRALQFLAVDVRRRVASFAFTPRAMPECPGASDDGARFTFDVSSPYKSMPRFFGRWVEEVPRDSTINDVVRMVHAKLWSFPDRDEEEEGTLVVLPDFVLRETTVILRGGDSEPNLFDPRQRHISPYVDGARLFRTIAHALPTQDGVPLVRVIALRR